MKGLTPRQKEIHGFILSFMEKEGRAPTLRETADAFGISPAGVHYAYRVLEEKGVLEVEAGSPRGITLPKEEREKRENSSVPLYPTEPSPKEMDEVPQDAIYLPRTIWNEDIFAFVVHSLSMTNGGILPGDTAILRKAKEAREGDIVLASAAEDEEAPMELRRYHKSLSSVELWSESDGLGIIRSQNVRIYGILIEIRRSY
ncbi:MAG: winged helix-turn-helix transcriptional regulator [Spirochaetales bacterium]|nr:winged helix-turn-helix transcriptional regulator [Candidatus Physcosoma equi]